MSGNTQSAGPALAAHSKDASTPGNNPASAATAPAKPVNDSGETIARTMQQVEDFVRGQPLASMGIFVAAGAVISRLLSRRR